MMQIINLKRLIAFIFLCIFAICEAKLPDLSESDVLSKANEIMRAHVTHKKLTPLLIKRSLKNYLKILDPGKLYFSKADIQQWLEPSDEQLSQILEAYLNNNFLVYWNIHSAMLKAIERRAQWEDEIAKSKLPKDIVVSEFRDLDWAKDELALFARLLRLKALQISAANKLEEDVREKALARMARRRLHHEEDIQVKDVENLKKTILGGVLKATASALDSQTMYFTPAEANQFMISVQQRLYGIGAQLRDDLNGFTVVKIIEGGPASRLGELLVDDRIIAVGSEPVVGMNIGDAVELIRGESGTTVHLTVLRGSENAAETVHLSIERGEVVLKDTRMVSDYTPYGDGIIATIKLHSFYQTNGYSSSKDLKRELEALQAEHKLYGVILDLRYNGGGVLSQAVEVAGLFMSKGIVVSIKDSDGSVQHLRDVDGTVFWEGPLMILVNKASASAAEIVAQTLQDYGRAIVVGDTRTFGKGTFQTFSLDVSNEGLANPQGEYKVTRGMYFTVSGRSPQKVGVQSQIEIPGELSKLNFGEEEAEYPLENDVIPNNFDDNLSDIPLLHRAQLSKLYHFDLQKQLNIYSDHVEVLRKNSQKRIESDEDYQFFLKALDREELDPEEKKQYSSNDLQSIEAVNVMKDLVLILKS